jgi:hypothetical protein
MSVSPLPTSVPAGKNLKFPQKEAQKALCLFATDQEVSGNEQDGL